MIGALLAGGYGKRLQSVAADVPKVLLPLKGDYLILDRQLSDFKKAEVDEVYLLTGYRGDMIEKRYGEEWKGIAIKYLREEQPKGTLWSVKNLYTNVNSDIILRNGDTLCDVDLREFIRFSKNKDTLASIVVTKMRSPYGLVYMSGSRVSKFVEKPLLNHYVNAGTYFLRKELGHVMKRNFNSKNFEVSVLKSLAPKGELTAYRFNGFWKPIDNPKDYEEAREIFSNRNVSQD
jgi:NDP-sugar pyrophosphorylase family protein